MLREHYVEEVRLRDRDGDGSLNRREYGGSREEFQRVDFDDDGLVGVDDLVREALDRSDSLREIVTGPWAPVYNRLLQVREPDEATLLEAVRAGTSAVHAAKQVQHVEQKEDRNIPVARPEDLLIEFITANKDLSNLHQRLQDLADRLGRFNRYTPIDAFA